MIVTMSELWQRGLRLKLGIFLAATLAGFVVLGGSALAAKVNLSPQSLTLTEGQSQNIAVTLDEPIICMDLNTPCTVSLAISTNAPERVAITGSPVIFQFNEWFQ